MPLYRDPDGKKPNITTGLLEKLTVNYGVTVSAEQLAGYVYALLGAQSYSKTFWRELEIPGPRVPLTKDSKIFQQTAMRGRRLIWLHTYAGRFREEGLGEEVPQGNATTIKGVSSGTTHYPVEYDYDPAKQEITVGDGRFGPVAPEVWEFEVSGFKVVQSWLGYRMKKRAGKKSSPLDDIRPEGWAARMSDEFLELLWVLESTLAMEPELERALNNIVAGPCFTGAELPTPKPEERKAPGSSVSATGGLLDLMGIQDHDDGVDHDADED
jgi:Type ISP C-terminal specificity domain